MAIAGSAFPARRAGRILVFLLVALASAGPRTAPAFNFQDLMLIPLGGPLPEFVLAPIDDDAPGFSSADLAGQVALLNVFASWCAPCREEHAVLLDLAERGVPCMG